MNRWTTVVATTAILLLAGCGGGSSETGPTDIGTSPPASPPPTESESPETPLTLPSCTDLFTEAQVIALMGDSMDALGDVSAPDAGGYGTSRFELQVLLEERDALNCTWILPASERGLTVSMAIIPEADVATIGGALAAVGATASSGSYAIHSFDESVETDPSALEYPYTEAHLIEPGLWVSALDNFGEYAPALVEAAADRVFALNPGR